MSNSIKECKDFFWTLKPRTLCFLMDWENVLLGLKKTGFGKWNYLWIWGKVEAWETIEEAVLRETLEEIHVKPLWIERCAIVNFYFPYVDNPAKWNQQGFVYIANSREWDISESDEVAPKWFAKGSLPLGLMWDDAKYRLPRILSWEKLQANFVFDIDLKVEEYSIQELLT